MAKLLNVVIENLKNVKHGEISLVNKGEYLNVIGIYGQNGSGKTTLINAVQLFKLIISNQKLNGVEYLSPNEVATISLEFDDTKGQQYLSYAFSLLLVNGQVNLVGEELRVKAYGNNKRYRSLLTWHKTDDLTLKILGKDANEDVMDYAVASSMNAAAIVSSEYMRNLLARRQGQVKYDELNSTIDNLRRIAFDINIYTDAHAGVTSLGLPLSFIYHTEEMDSAGVILVPNNDAPISKDVYMRIEKSIQQVNQVLPNIVPGLTLDTIVNQQLAADGEHMDYIIQLISVRESIDTKTNTKEIKKIPFRYESVGIIKIVSILPFLIEAYTNTESVVLIDELDSGIYEYLLGELVAIFEQGAFGQLIFTSHNLRVLEMLPQEKIVFSTTDEFNRYTHFEKIRDTNNLRKKYLRDIEFEEGQYYAPTQRAKIIQGFRNTNVKASNLVDDATKDELLKQLGLI
ncbi:AAA family ATPase [Periweissella fabalis]|uniref:AAA family ATPase n=1 Tax=Periweissella fabalis TaxID=1070421 RepID=A0A7X6S1X6_9LACO|nr:AAA family ATPase [Periweissella fabalis]MCM0599096.1 AAA family ATPase [Periweissella fabalis]NKZ23375.1 AAA family ATPase [Periweissella fabalis]